MAHAVASEDDAMSSNTAREIRRLQDESAIGNVLFAKKVGELKAKLADPAVPEDLKVKIRTQLKALAADERETLAKTGHDRQGPEDRRVATGEHAPAKTDSNGKVKA